MAKMGFDKDLTILLEYLWEDEKRHYQEWPSKNHIYLILRRIAKKIGFNSK